MRRIGKFPSGHGEGQANGGWSVRERPGACYPLIATAASTSTSNENASAIDPEGPMKLPFGKGYGGDHLDCSGHRRFTRSNRPGKSGATADEGPVRRQDPEGVAACSKRFYPVYSFSLILLLWRICHNGKGKAKSVIILMDLP